MSVLSHVVCRGPQQNEPAATQALTYILNKSPELVRALIGLLSDERLQFEPGRVDAELSIEDGQPDLTIYDQNGGLRVFVENKFWAGLTKAQPVAYLKRLSNEHSSALIFIVPYQRVPTVWNELKDRCDDSGLEWVAQPEERGEIRRAYVDHKGLMVVSWKCVLNQLLDVANSEGMDAVRADIQQLQGLTESMNLGAFLPLHEDEASNQEVPNRLINYVDLISDALEELKQAGVADITGLAWGMRLHSTGHFFRILANKKYDAWLGTSLRRWRDAGISPLWCRISGNGLTADDFRSIPDVFKVIRIEGDQIWIPIRLKTGVEREKVVAHAVAQIKLVTKEVLNSVVD